MKAGRVQMLAFLEQVTKLLLKYQQRFQIAPIFSEEEVRHYLSPVPDVIDTYVVEGPSKFAWS